jgi:hypothetical protein
VSRPDKKPQSRPAAEPGILTLDEIESEPADCNWLVFLPLEACRSDITTNLAAKIYSAKLIFNCATLYISCESASYKSEFILSRKFKCILYLYPDRDSLPSRDVDF